MLNEFVKNENECQIYFHGKCNETDICVIESIFSVTVVMTSKRCRIKSLPCRTRTITSLRIVSCRLET